MYSADFKARVQEILNFITEITLGIYTYTLPIRNVKDALEQIVLSLNTMVEEIDTAVHRINHEKSKEVIENVIFNLDHLFRITSYSDNVVHILKYSDKDLLNKPVKLLLGGDTKLPDDLNAILKHATEKNLSFKVEFRHKNGYLWSGYGYLHRLLSSGKQTYTLSVFKAVYYNEKLSMVEEEPVGKRYPSESRSLYLYEQRELIKKLHKYVTDRLDRSLKSLHVISQEVNSSITKVKGVFKQAYGTTIYAYHLQKRLDKSYVLVEETLTPLTEIAEECGFKSLAHFSRSFKKQFGVPPSKVRKPLK